jgi:hypothetical protein
MFGRIVRSFFAVVAGIAVTFFFVAAVEVVCAVLWPFPEGVDHADIQACKAHVASLPQLAFIIQSVGWGLAAFCSSYVATRFGSGRHSAHGIVLGTVFLAAAVFNMLMLPYPLWHWVANLILIPAGFVFGAQLGQAPRTIPATPDAGSKPH